MFLQGACAVHDLTATPMGHSLLAVLPALLLVNAVLGQQPKPTQWMCRMDPAVGDQVLPSREQVLACCLRCAFKAALLLPVGVPPPRDQCDTCGACNGVRVAVRPT